MNYYKILNKEEVYNGIQLKDGLNILNKPIVIYKEDIFCFLNEGPWIRKVFVSEENIKKISHSPSTYLVYELYMEGRQLITESVILNLIEEGANINVCDEFLLFWCAKHNYINVVKKILPKCNAKIYNSFILRFAIILENIPLIKLLLPYSDVKVKDCLPLRLAYSLHNDEITKLLIPYSDSNVIKELGL